MSQEELKRQKKLYEKYPVGSIIEYAGVQWKVVSEEEVIRSGYPHFDPVTSDRDWLWVLNMDYQGQGNLAYNGIKEHHIERVIYRVGLICAECGTRLKEVDYLCHGCRSLL